MCASFNDDGMQRQHISSTHRRIIRSTHHSTRHSFSTSKATQNSPSLPIDINTPHSHNLINKSDPLQSILKAEAQISDLESYVKCEICGLNNKMDSLHEKLNHLMHNKTSHSKVFELLLLQV